MRTFIFLPPLPRASGGLAVLHQIAGHLQQAGLPVWLVPREGVGKNFAPENFQPENSASSNNLTNNPSTNLPVPFWPFEELELTPKDIWLVPEGWPNALAPGLEAKCRNVVYVQNWAYLLSALPEGVRWPQLPVHFLAVSQPVAAFIRLVTGKNAPVLRPGLDLNLFCPSADQGNQLVLQGKKPQRLNIGYMPRKNKAVAEQARQIIEARQSTGCPLRWLPIDGKSASEVAATLKSCHIYMGTGFPEGFGLPPLEAMACGALPVSCAGFGAFDYLRQALPDLPAMAPLPAFAPPNFANSTLPNLSNAFIVPDADPLGLALAVEAAAKWIIEGNENLPQLLANGQTTARACSLNVQARECARLWAAAQQDEIF